MKLYIIAVTFCLLSRTCHGGIIKEAIHNSASTLLGLGSNSHSFSLGGHFLGVGGSLSSSSASGNSNQGGNAFAQSSASSSANDFHGHSGSNAQSVSSGVTNTFDQIFSLPGLHSLPLAKSNSNSFGAPQYRPDHVSSVESNKNSFSDQQGSHTEANSNSNSQTILGQSQSDNFYLQNTGYPNNVNNQQISHSTNGNSNSQTIGGGWSSSSDSNSYTEHHGSHSTSTAGGVSNSQGSSHSFTGSSDSQSLSHSSSGSHSSTNFDSKGNGDPSRQTYAHDGLIDIRSGPLI